MRSANQLVGRTLAELSKHIKPGITTSQLDAIAEEFIRANGAEPAFKHYPNPFGSPFPASICTSVNSVIVHGIPDDLTVLREGDVISIDCGTLFAGYNGDSCYTFCVGKVSDDARHLLDVTLSALYKGIEAATAGNHVGDIGYAIRRYCVKHGCDVVSNLTGHGIGRKLHEAPMIPNEGRPGDGVMLKEGMCLSIEPMAVLGSRKTRLLPDRWGMATLDGGIAVHYEHTIVVRRGKAEILSSFDDIQNFERANY